MQWPCFCLHFCFSLTLRCLITFGQCIRSMPVRRMHVQRLIRSAAFISIMDAYHAPYNRKHRYWTGLMLLTRCVLFLAFASSHRDSDILANTYIITLVLIAVLTVKTCATKVYRNVHMNTLELSSLLNLVILSATVYYLKGKGTAVPTLHARAQVLQCLSVPSFSLVYHSTMLIYG